MAELFARPAPHDPAAPPVQVEGVSLAYDGVTALRDVTFNLAAGARVAVVGPNGAGKSTLFKIMVGVLRPTSGEVRIYGGSPGGHVCIAYVPQRSQVDWTFPVSVADVVMMGRIRAMGLFRWPTPEDWRHVDAALLRVGMLELRGRQIGELSGGQQQRVFLAQALAQGAELVLLDEPLSGLDVPSQEAIFSILDELRTSGVTTLVATHDLNLAAERFDQILLLNRRLVALGPPAAVFTRPLLMEAYGGHMHLVPEGEGVIILTDTCCDGEEAVHE
jgi:manganese/iron transport system ATP-binding protein